MINSYSCWNCCGLRAEGDDLEDITCPNCGCSMDRAEWSVSLVEKLWVMLSPVQADANFKSIGPLSSNEPELLSYAVDEKHVELAHSKKNVAALFIPDRPGLALLGSGVAYILSSDPRADFFMFHNYLIEKTDFYGHSVVTQEGGAQVHSKASISVEDVIVERAVVIGPGVSVLPNTRIESGSTIAPGAVIGMPGARLIKRADGSVFQALHAGGVRIGRDVFIGPNSVIVKSVWRRPTIIGDGAFIGNLVNVGHNCIVEEGAVILPGAILCGRAVVQRGATVAPGAIISNGVTVGEGAYVTIGAVVTQDVPPGERVSGNFAVPHARQIEHVKRVASGRLTNAPVGYRLPRGPRYYDGVYRRAMATRPDIFERSRTLCEIVSHHLVGSVLDLGCGPGFLADFAHHAYLGIDFSDVAIQYAKDNSGGAGARFERGDLFHYDFSSLEGKCDTVALIEVLEHLSDPESVAARALSLAARRVVATVPIDMPDPSHTYPAWDYEKIECVFERKPSEIHVINDGVHILAVFDVEGP